MDSNHSEAAFSLLGRYLKSDHTKAANHLESMEPDIAAQILKTLEPEAAAEIIRHSDNHFSAKVLEQIDSDTARHIIAKLPPEYIAAMFPALSREMQIYFTQSMTEKSKILVQEMLRYPEDSAGRIMSSDFLALNELLTVKDAVSRIRQLADKGYQGSYVYVVDSNQRLVGILNMRDLLLAHEESTLQSVMRKNVFVVNGFMDREALAYEFSKRKFFAVPVVDPQERLIGIVKAEKLIGETQEEASEDMQKMFGAGADETAFSTVGFSLAKRLPWLHVNLATAFLAAFVVGMFEDLIARITVLAVFLPVVAGQGGNAGAQSLAVVMRGIVMREIPPNKIGKLVWKETIVGTLNGLIIGVVTALVAWVWHGNPYLGLVIGVGMLVNLAIAGFSGAAIPLAMKAIRLDPAQCSSIILTTITDVMGFFVFLGLAMMFQQYLI